MDTRVELSLSIRAPLTMESVVRLAAGLTPEGCEQVMVALGNRFARMTRTNFGPMGLHRPSEWSPLSPKYQREIGYFGPPKLVLTGNLVRSIHVADSGPGMVSVATEVEYAEEHQHGSSMYNPPARPFFPIADDQLTDYARTELQAEAQRCVDKILMGQTATAL